MHIPCLWPTSYRQLQTGQHYKQQTAQLLSPQLINSLHFHLIIKLSPLNKRLGCPLKLPADSITNILYTLPLQPFP